MGWMEDGKFYSNLRGVPKVLTVPMNEYTGEMVEMFNSNSLPYRRVFCSSCVNHPACRPLEAQVLEVITSDGYERQVMYGWEFPY